MEEYKRRKAAGQEIAWNEIKKEFRAKIETEFPFVKLDFVYFEIGASADLKMDKVELNC